MVCYLSYICRVFHHFHTPHPTFRTVRTELLAIICHYIVVIYITPTGGDMFSSCFFSCHYYYFCHIYVVIPGMCHDAWLLALPFMVA